MDLDALCRTIADWASGKKLIKRVYVFGSRARSDYRPDSDLDIAVELDPAEFPGSDESGGLATWMFETGDWQAEVQTLVGYVVDLEQLVDMTATPTIAKGVAASSRLAYEKSGASSRASSRPRP